MYRRDFSHPPQSYNILRFMSICSVKLIPFCRIDAEYATNAQIYHLKSGTIIHLLRFQVFNPPVSARSNAGVRRASGACLWADRRGGQSPQGQFRKPPATEGRRRDADNAPRGTPHSAGTVPCRKRAPCRNHPEPMRGHMQAPQAFLPTYRASRTRWHGDNRQ